MLRILFIEDHTSFRQALTRVINEEPDLEVVGSIDSLAAMDETLVDVDVAIVDLTLSDGNAIPLIERLRALNPKVMVVVLTASLDPLDHAYAIEAGAAGVLHKSRPLAVIVDSIRRLGKGEWLLSQNEIVSLLRIATQERERERERRGSIERLTPREREVLQAMAEGLSSKEIAERLCMTLETERTHTVNILSKLGAHSRLQAVVYAVRYGTIQIT